MSDFDLVFLDGPGTAHNNGVLKRRMSLRIDDVDKDVVTVTLDSALARQRQATRWGKAFSLDAAELESKLTKASVVAAEEAQRWRDRPEVRGAESQPPPPIHLNQARPTFAKWLQHVDPHLLDVAFGAVMAHRLDGDPVWLFIVGAPGDGKTECLRSMSDSEVIYTLSTLTPGALISGYITDGPDPSLLPKINNKVLIVKDFTAVLEMPNEARSEVLGILRDAYDGEACKVFGTGETKRYKSRFGLVAAVTPVIDSYWGVSAQLGERFLRFRLPSMGRQAKVKRALGNSNDEARMREELSGAALGVLAQQGAPPVVPPAIEEKLIALADFVSLARSEVARDHKHIVKYVPVPEVGTRVGKSLKKLAQGIALARGVGEVNDEIYVIVQRVALDTLPSMRAHLLKVLWRLRVNFELTAAIADEAEIGTDTVKVWLDDLRILGIAERGGAQRTGYTWKLRDAFEDTLKQAGMGDLFTIGGEGGEPAPPTSEAGDVRGAESPPPPLHTTRKPVFGHARRV